MKRQCIPMRADHKLLTSDTHTLSEVRLHPVIQVRSEDVISFSGHLSDSFSNESAVGSSRPRLVASPTRRLRFEDETETEVEFRYLERQRRRGGQRGTGALFSKPDLNLYISGRAGAGIGFERQQRGWMSVGGVGQCDSCGTVLAGGVSLNLQLHPPVPEDQGRSLHRPCLNLRTEPIRETYIGSGRPGETNGGGGGAVTNNQVRGRTNQVKLNGNQIAIPQATADLPINPYAPDQLTTSTSNRPYTSYPPPVTSTHIRLNSTKAGQNLTQKQGEQGPPAAKPDRQLRCGAELKAESTYVDVGMKSSSSSSSETAESQVPPTSGSNHQVRQPMRAEVHSDGTSLPGCLVSRDEPSRLSLRHLFSNVRLSRTRTGSLDRLSSWSCPLVSDSAPPGSRKSSGPMKNPSVSVGAPFWQLRKSSSLQSLVLEQMKKDRSADFRPAPDSKPAADSKPAVDSRPAADQ